MYKRERGDIITINIHIIVALDHFYSRHVTHSINCLPIMKRNQSVSQDSASSSIEHLLPCVRCRAPNAELCFPCLSITGPVWRPQRGWNEVNRWQTNKRDVLNIIPGCRGGIRPRCVLGNRWWKRRLSGVTHGWLHALPMAHSWTRHPESPHLWPRDPLVPVCQECGVVCCFASLFISCRFSFHSGLCEFADPSLLTP